MVEFIINFRMRSRELINIIVQLYSQQIGTSAVHPK